MLEFELASALHCIIHSHWQRLLQNSAFRPSVQVLRPPARLHLTLCHSCRQSHATDCRAEIQDEGLLEVERRSHERGAVAIITWACGHAWSVLLCFQRLLAWQRCHWAGSQAANIWHAVMSELTV